VELLGSVGQGPAALELPVTADVAEAPVLFLEGEKTTGAAPEPPLASATLAALYEAQGDPARAAEIRQALDRKRAASEGAARLEAWLDGLRDVDVAWLAAADGTITAEASRPGGIGRGAPKNLARVLQEVRGLAEVLGWGEPRLVCLVGTQARTAFAIMPGGTSVGFGGGPDALPGQMRKRLEEILTETRGPAGEEARPREETAWPPDDPPAVIQP
jgi:hypothetical protein